MRKPIGLLDAILARLDSIRGKKQLAKAPRKLTVEPLEERQMLSANPGQWALVGTGQFPGSTVAGTLWQNQVTGAGATEVGARLMQSGGSGGYAGWASLNFQDPSQWKVLGTGDFDGNGVTDILWEQPSTGLVGADLYNSNGTYSWVSFGYLNPAQWVFGGVGHFGNVNGNPTTDVLWQGAAGGPDNGVVGAWEIQNGASVGWASLGTADPTVWHVGGIGDFNGDGTSDVLWESNSGMVGAWLIKNAAASAWIGLAYADPAQWTIIGLADLTGKGTTDVLWQNTVNGAVGAWLISGGSISSWMGLGGASPSAWKLVGVGDLTNNGVDDLVWESLTSPGTYGAWLVQGNSISCASLPYADPSQWQLLVVANVAGDGASNMVWENVSSGMIGAWTIQDGAVVGWGQLGQV